jgi:hypothetical protein
MESNAEKINFARFPVISLSAEYLVMGYLMRRNILAYKAPPNNEGYDLICIHPDPRQTTRQVRVQVKSRLASDSDRGFPVKERSIDAFDFLVVAFLNVGNFFSRRDEPQGRSEHGKPSFTRFRLLLSERITTPRVRGRPVRLRGLDIERFKNEFGFEQIAQELRIEYPAKRLREGI